MNYLQKLGKSLMLPVSVLPICGILMGVGYLLCPEAMQGGEIAGAFPTVGFIMIKAGGAIIDNMAWLFVIGVSVGMSDDKNGAVCMAGLVSWLIVITLLSPDVISLAIKDMPETSAAYLAFSKIQNPFIAILCGTLAATCYNRFKEIKLPEYLAFFSGRRFVIIITALISLVLVVVLAVIWPILFGGLVSFGKAILNMGGFGAGLYAFLNRLLIPFGLHHALNNVFWFDTIGIGDLTNFWAGKVSDDVGWDLGMYMSGFFPCMMFGIPGAALAMIKNAKNKKIARGIILSTAICAFICGVTEPFEFMFMYAAFPLYAVYALMYGIFTVIVYYADFRAGFSFSAGATDLMFSASLPAAENTWLIIPLGIAAFAVFFVVFDLMIKKFGFHTPGREDEADDSETAGIFAKPGANDMNKAKGVIASVGGAGNIISVDCCATRLRLQLKDSTLVDAGACKDAGAYGVVTPDSKSCQVIIGLTVQQVCDAMQKCLSGVLTESCEERPVWSTEGSKPDNGESIYVKHTDILIGKDSIVCKAGGAGKECDAAIKGNTYKITDPLGVHARPAGKLAMVAGRYTCDITIRSGGLRADAKSVLSIMSLGIKQGDIIEVSASGKDDREAEAEVMNCLRDNL